MDYRPSNQDVAKQTTILTHFENAPVHHCSPDYTCSSTFIRHPGGILTRENSREKAGSMKIEKEQCPICNNPILFKVPNYVFSLTCILIPGTRFEHVEYYCFKANSIPFEIGYQGKEYGKKAPLD